MATLDCTRERGSGERNLQALVEFFVEEAAAWAVGLEPFAVDDHLWNGALTHMADDFVGGRGVRIDIDHSVGDAVHLEKLTGCAAVAAPRRRVKLYIHGS